MSRSFWMPPVVAIVAGLVLLLAGAAPWVTTTVERSVGGVVLTEPDDTPGTDFAPGAVAAGLAGLVLGIGLAAVRGRLRRVVGVVLGAAGVVGAVLVAAGVAHAIDGGGRITPAPFFAGLAALALCAAALSAVAGLARPPSQSRYRVAEERSEDDEWSLAADDDAG